ncbi:hypothetical protein B0H14DRAFT_1246906 [Mycena olivaceomarginata]|nr:hypothetical protein B0H14DRAFT_1246906 [Mycena olivaceomarginata]
MQYHGGERAVPCGRAMSRNAAGMKVLRPWVTGVGAGQRASNNIAVRDLEANGIGKYDDTVLNGIDRLTVLPLIAPSCP